MQYDELVSLRQRHPAWRLLRADHAPLVLSFLGRVFVEENARSLSATALTGRLDDELFQLNERLGEGTYPKRARDYLEAWAAPDSGWLRKYYPTGSEEAHFDLTPDVEKALAWLATLRARSFVGTESRLNTVLDLLRQMAFGSETDPAVRLDELHRRRQQLDEEIQRVSSGEVTLLPPAGLRDRYQQASATSRALLADFREVEANFRALDRELRERIAGWDGSKGELLDDVIGSRASIAESDQGRSFHAFYDFLLSPQRQAELVELLERVHGLDGIGEPDPRLRHIHHDWLEAGERTQATVRQLSEQLRRFLDDQVWLENRRVVEILRRIESTALALRDTGQVPLTVEIDADAPQLGLPLERPLYTPTDRTPLDSTAVREGETDLDTSLLFEQVYVDRARLAGTVRAALAERDQVSLPDLVTERPIEQGLAELVGYLSLDDPEIDVVINGAVRQRVGWVDDAGVEKSATVPAVAFVRVAGRAPLPAAAWSPPEEEP